ncbi:transcription factor A, mitochondrial isoform X1 [Pezoporus wallicus]|uniref:transcription factor A, mitochondrial isoform X1 n=1 Tax=Pezoporus wallicus TaxID=35540 RepID=UPI00254EF8D0|nr:transcription factor A, mitochondrial isoform X1 [Pezoporus wallicus]XP_061302975.1 transcription factor A, mitochondrial isoform X1 [Pezoporus flaviventris]
MAAVRSVLGRAATVVTGAHRLLRACGVASVEKCFSRGISTDEAPKRPMTAYLRFLVENRPVFKQKHPEINSKELLKKMAGAWRELPASQKQVYEEASKTEWQRYEKEVAAYKAQLTPAQAAALKEERNRQQAKRRSLRIKRELTVLGKPKKSRSAFNIFVSEKFKASEGISATAKMKQLYDTWQKLSSSQKQPYMQLAEDDKIRYENEMKLWEAKMIQLGREDLVRSRQKNPKKKTAETAKKAEPVKASSHEQKVKQKLKKSEE